MNKTKKLTQGAMMLAIIGALIIIDRMIAFMFTELLVLMMPVVIIMYCAMYTIKDGLMLSIGLAIISFLLGNFNLVYLIYVPVGILTGIVYSLGVRKGTDRRTLLFLAILTYAAGEIIASFIVYPLLGFPVATMISEFKLAFSKTASFSGIDYESLLTAAGLNFDKLLVIVYIVSTVVMGAMEGVLIHLISVFLLKRFKIKDLGRVNLWDIKPNPTLAYICFISLFSFFLNRYIENEILYNVTIVISLLASMVLLYYAYIFVILYGIIVLKRNIGPLVVLLAFLIPGLLIGLIIIGFLYGSGPLRQYLETRIPNQS